MGATRHRIALPTLQAPLDEGGLAVPDFELYHAAAQLQWPTQWLSSEADPKRAQIQSILGTRHIYTWLSSPKHPQLVENSLMRTVRTS